MAVGFRALLSAINSDESSTSEKLKALLTVFNYAPGEIDPDRDLSIGGPVSTLFRSGRFFSRGGRFRNCSGVSLSVREFRSA